VQQQPPQPPPQHRLLRQQEAGAFSCQHDLALIIKPLDTLSSSDLVDTYQRRTRFLLALVMAP
jgi:hypothetical protein